jgi:glycosyltransferase involved in cell wall biosynthesis
MKPEQISLSVILPACNEEENLEKTFRQINGELKRISGDYEIIIVDDGSTDSTGKIAGNLAGKYKNTRVITHQKNRGFGGVMKSGYYSAKKEWVILIPADGQFPVSCLKDYIESREGVDVVVGVRKGRQDNFIRKISTFLYKNAVRIMFGINLREFSWVNLFRRKIFDDVKLESEGIFAFEEILIKASDYGYRFRQIEVPHGKRGKGKSKTTNFLKIIDAVFSPIHFWWKLRVRKEESKILFKKKAIKVEISEKFAPKWLGKREFLAYFPRFYKKELKGEIVASIVFNGSRIPAISKQNGRYDFNFDPDETIYSILNEWYTSFKKPIYTRSPVHYHKIPFRMMFAKFMTWWNRRKLKKIRFPRWPYDFSADILREICGREFKVKWADGKKYCAIFTHDVDTSKGMGHVKDFSDLEEKYGIASCFYFVSSYYPLDDKLMKELLEKGFEIGSHGYNHDNKLAFLGKKGIEERIRKVKKVMDKYRAVGFRSPSLLRTDELFDVLRKNFIYDSTVPDTDMLSPVSIRNGCCTVFPFVKRGILEIPITVPMDAQLLLMGYKPEKILRLMKEKIMKIKKIGGVAVINIHPEEHFSANKKMLEVYENLLQFVSSDKDAWICRAKDLAGYLMKKYPKFREKQSKRL